MEVVDNLHIPDSNAIDTVRTQNYEYIVKCAEYTVKCICSPTDSIGEGNLNDYYNYDVLINIEQVIRLYFLHGLITKYDIC